MRKGSVDGPAGRRAADVVDDEGLIACDEPIPALGDLSTLDLTRREHRVRVMETVGARRQGFSLTKIVARPDSGDEGGPLTDTQSLREIGYSLVILDLATVQDRADALLAGLERRVTEFVTPAMTDRRFEGWCSAIQSLVGLLGHATRRFLEHEGVLLVDGEEVRRVETLLISGLGEITRRFDRHVREPADWLRADRSGDWACRVLSAAWNTLAGMGYQHVTARPVECSVPVLGAHPDVLLRVLAAGGVYVKDSSDPFYRTALETIERFKSYFDQRGAGSFLSTMRNPVRPQHEALTARDMFATFLKAAHELHRDEDIDDLATTFGLDDADLDRVVPGRRRRHGKTEAADSWATASAEAHELEMTDRLSHCNRLRSAGRLQDASACLPAPDAIQTMSLGDLHVYMRLMPELAHDAIGEALRGLRNRFNALAPHSIGVPNFVARLIEYEQLVDGHFQIEEANLLCDLLGQCSPSRSTARVRILIALDQDRVGPSLLAPLLPILREANLDAYSLQENGFVNSLVSSWRESPRLTLTSEFLRGSTVPDGVLMNDWQIDLDRRELTCGGIDYFEGVYERIARMLKVYTVEWELPYAQKLLRRLLVQVDRVVVALDGVREVAEVRDFQVRLVSLQSHYAPWSVLRVYSAAHPERFEHVTVSASYENWKTNIDGSSVSTLAMLNNTRCKTPSVPAFGTAPSFRAWVDDVYRPNQKVYLTKSADLTAVPRSGAPTEATKELVRELRAHRRAGHLIFCMLGKIPYDLAVPYQGGPAHASISDWVNHTISTIGSTNNVLLVKPHPHEKRLEISANPIEDFVGMIGEPDVANLKILPHIGVNLSDLMDIVDVFLCWNGSAVAEIGARGGRVVAADDWASLNYPINVFLPESRAHYESILRAQEVVDMHEDFAELSRAYVCYLTEAPFAFAYPFVIRSSTNTRFNACRIDFMAFRPARLAQLEDRRHEVLAYFAEVPLQQTGTARDVESSDRSSPGSSNTTAD